MTSIEPNQRDQRSAPQRRVILLGASNVARGVSTIVEAAQLSFNEPLEFMAAFGHGRSYGLESTAFFRKFSGIFFCDLWPALERAKTMPTTALLTDIGNDILYGASNKEILNWVEGCLDRLEAAGAKTIVTSLPIGAVSHVSNWQFLALRSILFPSSRLTLDEVVDRANELQLGVEELARKKKVSLIPQKNEWFGLDPIHIRHRCWSSAWPEIIRPWTKEPRETASPRGSLRRWFFLRSRVPHERWICGLRQSKEQPSGKLTDGSTLAFY